MDTKMLLDLLFQNPRASVTDLADILNETEEDVEKATGLMVLTSIPDYNIENNRKKGGRR